MTSKILPAASIMALLLAAPALAQDSSQTVDQPNGAVSTEGQAPAMAPAAGTEPAPAGDAAQAPASDPALSGSAAQQGDQAATASAQPMDQAQPLAGPQSGQIMGSDLRGTRVYGANDESIGDISDIVVDRDGRLVAVVVGVGGFLGIGEKDVAIPFAALEIVDRRTDAAAMRARQTQVPPAPGLAPAAGTVGDATGSVAAPGTVVGAAPADVDEVGTINPSRIVLRGMTKQDLENAPSFDARAPVQDAAQ
jgi:hypothetical protein